MRQWVVEILARFFKLTKDVRNNNIFKFYLLSFIIIFQYNNIKYSIFKF